MSLCKCHFHIPGTRFFSTDTKPLLLDLLIKNKFIDINILPIIKQEDSFFIITTITNKFYDRYVIIITMFFASAAKKKERHKVCCY